MQKLGVEVLSVSIDSMFVHKMRDDDEPGKMVSGGVPFAMLSDARPVQLSFSPQGHTF
jgi:alkyl hydroperoxide reductase subunit AhpC